MSNYMIIRAKNSEVANRMDRDVLDAVNDHIAWSAWQQISSYELVKMVALDAMADEDIDEIKFVINHADTDDLDYKIVRF